MDAKSRVIAFGGRALLPDQQPKYLNSPETALFHKGRVLFNLAAAREAAKSARLVIVAEGYMDVIALRRAGFANAVAPLGTALTDDQLRLLWTMSPLPTLCFDGDEAGQKAAHRALDTALPHLEPGRSLQFAFLPDGRDPDDMVSGGAKDALAKVLGEPVPLIDVLWTREQNRHPLQTPEQRASLEARLTEAAQRIEHRSLKFHYVSILRERLRAQGQALRSPARRADASSWRARASATPSAAGRRMPGRGRDPASAERTSSLLASKIAQPSAPSSAPREALLIVAILRHPWLLDEHLEEIASLHLDDADCCCVRNVMLTIHQTEVVLDNEKLLEHLSNGGFGAAVERCARASAHNADSQFAPGANREQVLEGWRHVMMLHGKAGVPHSLVEAENDCVSEPSNENFSKLYAVKQQVEIAAS